jgi:hypothetical protein
MAGRPLDSSDGIRFPPNPGVPSRSFAPPPVRRTSASSVEPERAGVRAHFVESIPSQCSFPSRCPVPGTKHVPPRCTTCPVPPLLCRNLLIHRHLKWDKLSLSDLSRSSPVPRCRLLSQFKSIPSRPWGRPLVSSRPVSAAGKACPTRGTAHSSLHRVPSGPRAMADAVALPRRRLFRFLSSGKTTRHPSIRRKCPSPAGDETFVTAGALAPDRERAE